MLCWFYFLAFCRQKVLVTHENSNIDITGKSLQCLQSGAWLNDEVMCLILFALWWLGYLFLKQDRKKKMNKVRKTIAPLSIFLHLQVINVYLELLKERENQEPQKFLRCHFFNTFFYKSVCYPFSSALFYFLSETLLRKKHNMPEHSVCFCL